MSEFGLNYKKRAKKERKGSTQDPDLLTPTRYSIKKFNSENEDSEHSSSFCNSDDVGNGELSEDEINRSINSKRSRRHSADTTNDNPNLEVPGRIRTRANSQDTRAKVDMFDGMRNDPVESKEKREVKEEPHNENMEVEEMLNGL
jgi:hypothetical protein